ncbi:hypothetical protein PHMEG_00028311 [Phytophthora megakarya]|uniref:Hydrophobin n=1 Tax=Phytophthora megakarya TaxID=4795 RepID=A0A225V6H2_9STRA|nr:hypothetical protein PHMEG_00028311 [Phytophthora megakarya]
MQIATVLAVASLGGVFGQDEQLAHNLQSADNETQSLSQLFLMAMNEPSTPNCWNPGQCCEINSANAGDLKLGTTCNLPIPFPTDNYVSDKRVNKFDDAA